MPPIRVATIVAVLVSTLPVVAQTKSDKTKPAPPRRAADATKPRKDDAVTAKAKVIVALDKFAKAKVSSKRADWRTSLPEPPKQAFDAAFDYLWHLQTNHGEITVRLRPDVAPIHVTSVIYLTRVGFYDGLVFHRAIKGFMAQGGCPLGTGGGNAGFRMDGEFGDEVKHDRPGILSTANEGRPKTDGSQFFITYAPTPHLDGKHTIFGEVIEGMPAVQAFEERSGTPEADKPTAPLELQRAWITVTKRQTPAAAVGPGADGKPGKDGAP